jgi:hypothetical protein
MFTAVKSEVGVSSARLAKFEGTIADTGPIGDRKALDSTPRERISNRGGGYARDVEVVPTATGHMLQVGGPASIVTQIRLTDLRYTQMESLGRHRLRGVGQSPTRPVIQLLDLLRDVLSLPCGPQLDYALALDWYKKPIEGVVPTAWPNTPTGQLVKAGKYWYAASNHAVKQIQCGVKLVDRLLPVIGQHPLLNRVDAVAAVPGHDSKVVSFGGRLAAAVAKRLSKPVVRCGALSEFRPPAKRLDLAERAAMIDGQFVCAERLDGQSLLVIDDVFSSGSTAEETARALRAAGATRVASLCAVRTMRS